MSEPRVRARYGHTNLIARDWRALADFYRRVFGAVLVLCRSRQAT